MNKYLNIKLYTTISMLITSSVGVKYIIENILSSFNDIHDLNWILINIPLILLIIFLSTYWPIKNIKYIEEDNFKNNFVSIFYYFSFMIIIIPFEIKIWGILGIYLFIKEFKKL